MRSLVERPNPTSGSRPTRRWTRLRRRQLRRDAAEGRRFEGGRQRASPAHDAGRVPRRPAWLRRAVWALEPFLALGHRRQPPPPLITSELIVPIVLVDEPLTLAFLSGLPPFSPRCRPRKAHRESASLLLAASTVYSPRSSKKIRITGSLHNRVLKNLR